mgnify:CR=1 FL=1
MKNLHVNERLIELEGVFYLEMLFLMFCSVHLLYQGVEINKVLLAWHYNAGTGYVRCICLYIDMYRT